MPVIWLPALLGDFLRFFTRLDTEVDESVGFTLEIDIVFRLGSIFTAASIGLEG